MLPTPAFHHLHLNSVDPHAAIEFYTTQFPSATRTTWAGLPALKSPNDVLVLFTKVDSPPATQPATALWHFGWHVTDARASLAIYKSRPQVKLLPLYTTEDGGSVLINSDTWPGVGGVLGLTKAQIAEARATGVKPKGGAGGLTWKVPMARLWSMRATIPLNASITCTCGRTIHSARSSGTRSISTRRRGKGSRALPA